MFIRWLIGALIAGVVLELVDNYDHRAAVILMFVMLAGMIIVSKYRLTMFDWFIDDVSALLGRS